MRVCICGYVFLTTQPKIIRNGLPEYKYELVDCSVKVEILAALPHRGLAGIAPRGG